jgi:hypothetical protein
LPTHPYDCCRIVPARVNRFSLVTFETNRYSVPSEYAGRQVLLKASVDRLQVALQDRVIADHPRSYQREGDFLDPQHFLRLLLERPGAWEHSKAIREWQARWPLVYSRYWAALRTQWPEPQNVREFVRILMLERTFTEPRLAVALEWALAVRCYTCEGLLRHLREQAARVEAMPASSGMPSGARTTPKVAVPDLAQYQQLTLVGGRHGN